MATKSNRYRLIDPMFNDFVFNSIVSASVEQKAKLPYDLYAWAQSEARAKQFTDISSLERKIFMLSHLGIEVSLWFAPPEFMKRSLLLETMEDYKEDKLKNVNKMIGKKSFVFTDRNVMAMMNMMAQSCHSEVFMLNRDYYRLSQAVTKLSDAKLNSVDAAKPAMSEYKLLCKFMLHMLLHREHYVAMSGYKDLELAILMYLFIHRHTYVEQNTIVEVFQPAYERNSVKVYLARLRKSLHLDRLPASRIISYTISSKGMQVVGSYTMRLVSQTFNS